MDAIEALRTRRCVRAFRREAVDRETLEEVVDCGRLAPTALNVQPWEFVVVTDKTMLQRIAQATDHGRFIADAGACIVVLSKATKYYLEDGSAATENILLACHARGLGACWVEGPVAPTRRMQKFKELIKIPTGFGEYRIHAYMSLGWPHEQREHGQPQGRTKAAQGPRLDRSCPARQRPPARKGCTRPNRPAPSEPWPPI